MSRTAILPGSRVLNPVMGWAMVLTALYALSAVSYLLFHSVAEIFTIVIEFSVFVTAWNGRRFLANHYLLFLGCANAGVAVIDVMHVLAYRGMGVFPAATDANLATQLWIAGRFLAGVSVAGAPWFLTRRRSPYAFMAGCLGAAAALLYAVFAGVFPACFVEGKGLTPFKVGSEYAIAALFATGAVLLVRQRRAFDRPVLQLLVWSIAIQVAAELAFTTYIDAYGPANMIGHLLRTVASWLLYKAIVETAFMRPYDLVFRDLTERENELQASVGELEAFSYSVSHDLRAPLSAIAGFAELLQRECGSALSGDPVHYLERIRAAAKRMNDLIDDLLRLSRLSRQTITTSPVDISSLAAEVVAELRERTPERHVEIAIAAGIRCDADPALIRAVLENLIGNAWKFTSRRDHARIEIGADAGSTFYIRDNGAGFEPEHVSRLFAPFQRLHRADEFPGSGIGLATVKRIVARHGGRVSAEGAVDAGATFRVWLPKARS